MKIIIVSNEPWGNIWFSKHHYAYELSKTHQVIFINPCKSWSILNLFRFEVKTESISENLKVLEYSNILPSFFLKLNNWIVSKNIKRHLNRKNFKPDIFWTFDPMRLFEPKFLESKKGIFHVVDRYLFSHPAETILHRNVDAFICVSNNFIEQYKNYQKPILVVPHGISAAEFEIDIKDYPIPYDDYILYLGNVDLRLDYKFICELLQKFPDEKFVFVGGMKKVEDPFFYRLFNQNEFPNLIKLPPVHANDVKYFIRKSKCCIAPMKKEINGNLISHHKIFQYMAQGKPVFSPVFTEYVGISNLLYMNNEDGKLIELLAEFLKKGEKAELKDLRIDFIKDLKYDKHVEAIFNFLEKEINLVKN